MNDVTEHTSDGDWRALVAFTTSNRAAYVRRCLPSLARACVTDKRLALLVALDGDDSETRELCTEWQIPLLYSDLQEGVGLSKNRVLERFTEYDYYFFLEDDVEVLDGSVFAHHVALMRSSGIHHMALFDEDAGGERVCESSVLGERIVHFRYGSAEFNVFTSEGLAQVGGWHPLFAQYRRWGHTEHSSRFARTGLAPAPFNVAVGLANACIRHRPASVTAWRGAADIDEHGISLPERQLIQEALTHVPLQTLASYHVSDMPPGQAVRLAAILNQRDRYPLLSGAAHRQAIADYLVWRSSTVRGAARVPLLLAAGLVSPRNIALRHAVKIGLLSLRDRVRTKRP